MSPVSSTNDIPDEVTKAIEGEDVIVLNKALLIYEDEIRAGFVWYCFAKEKRSPFEFFLATIEEQELQLKLIDDLSVKLASSPWVETHEGQTWNAETYIRILQESRTNNKPSIMQPYFLQNPLLVKFVNENPEAYHLANEEGWSSYLTRVSKNILGIFTFKNNILIQSAAHGGETFRFYFADVTNFNKTFQGPQEVYQDLKMSREEVVDPKITFHLSAYTKVGAGASGVGYISGDTFLKMFTGLGAMGMFSVNQSYFMGKAIGYLNHFAPIYGNIKKLTNDDTIEYYQIGKVAKGMTLAKYKVNDRKHFLTLFSQLLKLTEDVSKLGVMLYDLNEGNIMIDDNQRVTIIDYEYYIPFGFFAPLRVNLKAATLALGQKYFKKEWDTMMQDRWVDEYLKIRQKFIYLGTDQVIFRFIAAKKTKN